jgi:WD40 repeat protein
MGIGLAFGQTTDERKLELVVQTGHTNIVKFVVFSPDGKLLASTSLDSTIKIWDVQMGQEIKSLGKHSGILKLIFSADGKNLLGVSPNQIFKIWDVQTGQEIRSFQPNTRRGGFSIALSPDKKHIAYAYDWDNENLIKILDADTGNEIKTFIGHSKMVMQLAFSPDGKSLASLSEDDTAKIWDVQTGKELQSLAFASPNVFSAIVFSGDGKMLAVGSYEKTVYLMETKSGQIIKRLSGKGETHIPLAFSENSKNLATIDDNGGDYSAVRFWDLAGGNETKNIEIECNCKEVAINTNLDTLAISGESNTYDIALINVRSGKEIKTLTSHSAEVKFAEFLPNGKQIFWESECKGVRFWNLERNREIKAFKDFSIELTSTAVSLDEKVLVGGDDFEIILWDIETGERIKTFQVSETDDYAYTVNSVAISPNKKLVAGGVNKGNEIYSIRLWDIETGKELKPFGDYKTGIRGLIFSPDNKTIASRDFRKNIRLWNLADGKEIITETIPDWVKFKDETIIKQNGLTIKIETDEGQIK